MEEKIIKLLLGKKVKVENIDKKKLEFKVKMILKVLKNIKEGK